ncbi:MAG: 4Fe-4S dicluster domain-containing protein [Chloroflexota bacterium]
MAEKAILFDVTKCMACRACQVACHQWNDLPAEMTTNRGTYENPPDLSPTCWIKIRFNEVPKAGGGVDWVFTRQSCMHCTDASCIEVCPTGALYHSPDGFVAYNEDLCSGCGYCVEFCPFSVPRSAGSTITGIRKMKKCLFCADRVAEDNQPACVKTCPPGALTFGNRDDLVIAGKQRVKEIQATYPSAYLYGEKELGGLHVLYVLTYPPEVHGLPAKPEVPLAASVWKNALQPIGWGLVGLTVAGLGLNYIVARATVNAERERITRWMCPTCGYIRQGDEPPDQCPVSGDPGKKFTRMEE